MTGGAGPQRASRRSLAEGAGVTCVGYAAVWDAVVLASQKVAGVVKPRYEARDGGRADGAVRVAEPTVETRAPFENVAGVSPAKAVADVE